MLDEKHIMILTAACHCAYIYIYMMRIPHKKNLGSQVGIDRQQSSQLPESIGICVDICTFLWENRRQKLLYVSVIINPNLSST